ncbi:MAG: FAD-dependent oxidoreductase [Fimbriimonadaceae bacterium]|nr:FAD-dependent oxidoreductase [Fimbriimonadaceae bacterium]
MNRLACAALLLLAGPLLAAPAALLLLEAEGFSDLGGWDLDQQSMDQMGSPYLLAHGLGVPVRDAVTSVDCGGVAKYRVWVRTRDWVAPWQAPGAPGRFQVLIGGQPLSTTFGTEGAAWHWQDGGLVTLVGRETLALHDLTGFEGRCDAVLLARDPAFRPPHDGPELATLRRLWRGEPARPADGGSYDLVVVGGGIAGTCAALAAARQGLQVALIQDRPVLGGNGSSEVRVWPEGKTRQRPYQRVGDIVEELLTPKAPGDGNARGGSIYGDGRKLDLVRAEPRIRLLLEQHVNAVEVRGGRIRAVVAVDVRSGRRTRYAGALFADCTGDGTVGFLAGADYTISREGLMGASNLWNTLDTSDLSQVLKCECKDREALSLAVQEGQTAAPFPRCPWALDLSDKPFPGRRGANGQPPAKPTELGGWFWESGFDKDMITDLELIRDNNFRAMYGAWDTLKNIDGLYPNHRLGWAAFIAGKRESRRLLGDVLLTGSDFRSGRKWPDGCFPCSWHIDLHTPHPAYAKGFEGTEFISTFTHGAGYTYQGIYWAPYRALYSRNVANLFMAGRDISVDKEALGPVRVMRTGGMMGEAVGKAAWIARRHGCNPRGVYQQHLPLLLELLGQPGALRRSALAGELELPPGALVPPIVPPGLDPRKLPGIVIDDLDAALQGNWGDTGNLTGFVGDGYRYSSDPAAAARFAFRVPADGIYEIRIAWLPHENRAKTALVSVEGAAEPCRVRVNQTQAPSGPQGFGTLGRCRFQAAQPAAVVFTVAGAGGNVHIDAVQVLAVP